MLHKKNQVSGFGSKKNMWQMLQKNKASIAYDKINHRTENHFLSTTQFQKRLSKIRAPNAERMIRVASCYPMKHSYDLECELDHS